MSIFVICECGKELRVRDEMAGKKGKCPACGQSIVVPTASDSAPDDPFESFLTERTDAAAAPARGSATAYPASRTGPPYAVLILGVIVAGAIFSVYRFDLLGMLQPKKPAAVKEDAPEVVRADSKEIQEEPRADAEDELEEAPLDDPPMEAAEETPEPPTEVAKIEPAPAQPPKPAEPAATQAETESVSADEQADQLIVDLYKRKELANRRDYKKVRAAVAKRFELKNAVTIESAYGEDFKKFSDWLAKHVDLKEDFYAAIDQHHDTPEAALRIFNGLWKRHPEKFAEYGQLAIATALTWDAPGNVYSYEPFQSYTHSTLPGGQAADPLVNFDYLLEHEKVMQGRGIVLPWEFLTHVVNHQTPIAERDWALNHYLSKRKMFGSCYHDVPYDYGMLDGETPKLNGSEYTLVNLRQLGGVCAMQADFAARVGKSMGVPAEYVRGDGRFGGAGHAWVMWVEINAAAKGKVRFTLESYGRYQIDNYYTGEIQDPQTGQIILDRDLERRLANVGADAEGKRQADWTMRAYPLLCEKLNLNVADRIKFLDDCLELSMFNEQSWLELARLAKEGELKASQQRAMRKRLDNLFVTFQQYPDFTWKVFDDLLAPFEKYKDKKTLYLRLIQLYVRSGRPDLACEARLKFTDYLTAADEHREAADGLADTIMAFPDEGRYVPRMVDKLEEVAENIKDGSQLVAAFYVRLLPKVPRTRGDRVSDYCVSIYEQAIAYLNKNGHAAVADNLEQQLQTFKKG